MTRAFYFYRVWYCISYRTENKLFYLFIYFIIRLLIQLRIRILPSTSKKSRKNVDFYCFFTFLSLKNEVNVPSKRISIKTNVNSFLALLKVTDEQSKILIRKSSAHIVDKKNGPVCHWYRSNLFTWKENNLGGLSHLRFSARIHD